jgi:hypothetical protein
MSDNVIDEVSASMSDCSLLEKSMINAIRTGSSNNVDIFASQQDMIPEKFLVMVLEQGTPYMVQSILRHSKNITLYDLGRYSLVDGTVPLDSTSMEQKLGVLYSDHRVQALIDAEELYKMSVAHSSIPLIYDCMIIATIYPGRVKRIDYDAMADFLIGVYAKDNTPDPVSRSIVLATLDMILPMASISDERNALLFTWIDYATAAKNNESELVKIIAKIPHMKNEFNVMRAKFVMLSAIRGNVNEMIDVLVPGICDLSYDASMIAMLNACADYDNPYAFVHLERWYTDMFYSVMNINVACYIYQHSKAIVDEIIKSKRFEEKKHHLHSHLQYLLRQQEQKIEC